MAEVKRLISCTTDGSLPTLVQDKLNEIYPLLWQPVRDYELDEIAVLPNGTIGTALSSFVSGATFDTTEQSRWLVTSGGTGGGGSSAVTSVNARIGDVVITKADLSLENVDNSKDEWKWVAAAGRLSSDYKINGVTFNATQDITVPVEESVTPRTWHDILSFGTINGWPLFERHATGGAWSTATLGREVFDQKDGTYTDLLADDGPNDACRYTWYSNELNWCQLEHFVLILNNIGSVARTFRYTVQHSDDGTTWTDFGTLDSPDWSVTLDLRTSWQWGGWPWMRLVIQRISGTGGLRMTSIAGLTRRMGDQGGGRETEFPYGWDGNQVISFRTNPLIPSAPTDNAHPTRKDYVDGLVGGKEPTIAAGTASQFLRGDKTLGTLPLAVADGGSGRSTATTAYGLIAAGTSATAVHQTLPTGTAGEVLKSGGAGALPTWGTVAVGNRLFVSSGAVPDPANVVGPQTNDIFIYPNSGDLFRYSGTAWNYDTTLGANKAPLASPALTGSPTVGGLPIATTTGAQALTNKTLTDAKINSVAAGTGYGRFYDENGKVVLETQCDSSPVNYLRIKNKNTGSTPSIEPAGTDASIGVLIVPKGAGAFRIASNTAGQSAKIVGDNTAGDANVNLDLQSKGTGTVQANGVAVATTATIATKVNGSVNGVATGLTLWTGTQAQYDALGTWPSTTVYVVT